MALHALQLGFEVSLLEVPRPDVGRAEFIPSGASHLLAELQLDGALVS